MYRDEDNYVYSTVTLIIARIGSSNGKLRYVGSVHRIDKEIWVEADCIAGKYVAYILTSWCRKVNCLGFSIYGVD